MLLASVACGGGDSKSDDKKGSSSGRSGGFGSMQPATAVEVVAVRMGSITQYQVTNGRLRAIQNAPVTARVSEMCIKVLHEVGDRVKKGDAMAKLRNERFTYNVLKVEASVEQSKQRVREARLEYDKRLEDALRIVKVSFEESNPSEDALKQYQHALEEKEANRKVWLTTYASLQLNPADKTEDRAVQERAADRAHQAYDKSVKDVIALILPQVRFTQASIFTQDELLAARVEAEKAEAAWKVAQATVQSSLADLESAKLDVDFATIRAPMDGVIVKRNVEEFDTVAANDIVFELAQLDDLKIDLKLAESAANWLENPEIGDDGELKVESAKAVLLNVTAMQKERFLGYVDLVSPVIDDEEGSIDVRIRVVRNPNERAELTQVLLNQLPPDERELAQGTIDREKAKVLKPGMWAEAKVVSSYTDQTLVIPSTAIVNGVVYLVAKDESKAKSWGGSKGGDKSSGKGEDSKKSGGSSKWGGGSKSGGKDKKDEGPKLKAIETNISKFIGKQSEGLTEIMDNAPIKDGDYVVWRGIEYLKDESPIKVKEAPEGFDKKFPAKSEDKGEGKGKGKESKDGETAKPDPKPGEG